ncbi:hypothetical protein, partial [Geodermatophilus sp. CPCC 205761]|uniref:hypothetical protein n=1 Tax=Geodermatophilus sp. CPCC 205761 TaxID=2936597 RepID=UPI003EEDEF8D
LRLREPRWRRDADEAVADALRRARRTRRGRVAAGIAILAAAALAVPLAWPAGSPVAPPPASAAPATVPVLTEPTRGSLAGDRVFVEAVRQLDWGPLVPPPVAARDVVLATDTPAGRVVLVTGTVDEDVRGVWFTGPAGAPPEALTPAVPRHLGPGRPASLLVGGPGAATVVVVAGREDEVEVSPRLQVGPRGTVQRGYEPARTVDGVAVGQVRTTTGGSGASVRVLRDGAVVYRAPVGLDLTARGPAPEPPSLAPLRPTAVRPAPRAVAEALAEVAVPLGVEPAELLPELLWSGLLPLDGVPGTAAVVVARSPGGGLVVTTWAAQVGPGGNGRAVPCGVYTAPGAFDVTELVAARVCDLSSPESEPSDEGRWLVLTAPPDATAAAVLDDRGGLLTTLALDGGGVVAALPDGARAVRTLDAGGRAVAEVPVAAAPVAPFGDYGGGPVR